MFSACFWREVYKIASTFDSLHLSLYIIHYPNQPIMFVNSCCFLQINVDPLHCAPITLPHRAHIFNLVLSSSYPLPQAQGTVPRRAWSSWPAGQQPVQQRSLFTSWRSSAVLWSWERPPPGLPTHPRTSVLVRPTSSSASPLSTPTLPPDQPGRELASHLIYPSQLKPPSGPPRASSTSTLQARSKPHPEQSQERFNSHFYFGSQMVSRFRIV